MYRKMPIYRLIASILISYTSSSLNIATLTIWRKRGGSSRRKCGNKSELENLDFRKILRKNGEISCKFGFEQTVTGVVVTEFA